MTHFRIAKGTKCKVRRLGEADWLLHFTTKNLVFVEHGIADNGGTWTFEFDGWEI